MDAELNRYLDYELKLLKNERELYSRRLELCRGYDDIRLKKVKHRNGKSYYYEKRRKSDAYVYLGTCESSDVTKICEAHMLKEAVRRIDSNINLLNKVIKDYLPWDVLSVNAALPSSYRIDVPPMSLAYQHAGEAWKKKKLSFQAEFPENYPEFKTETTSDGIKVKTISEVVLYERLKDAGLYQIYELPLVLDDYGPPMYPDSTVLSPVDMKTEIYVEYVGRLDLPKYREDFARKVRRYIENGYIPGVNVFFVFADKDGHIDSLQINRVIADIKGI